MSCRICGSGNCTESFHSIEEQKRAEVFREIAAQDLLTPAEHDEVIAGLEAEIERLREALEEIRGGPLPQWNAKKIATQALEADDGTEN
jgi:hypothetical protein